MRSLFMEQTEIFEKLKALNLPAGKFVVFGSGPMCIRGWKDCGHDLDIIVTEDVWDTYKDMQDWSMHKMDHGSEYLCNGVLELWKDWKPGVWDIKKLIEEAEIISGLPFVKLEHVLKWKELSGREKDMLDAKIIRNME